MRLNRKVITLILLLVCSCPARPAAAPGVRASGASGASGQAGDEVKMLGPSDLFSDFPALEWGMSIEEARAAVEKAGAHPLVSRSDEGQLTWDGKFGGMDGRATVIFKKGTGIYEIAVIAYAYDKRQEVFERFLRKLVDRHGEAKETSDTSTDTSKVWRLKNGFAIELRLIKDDDSPVIDVHWVKEQARAFGPTEPARRPGGTQKYVEVWRS